MGGAARVKQSLSLGLSILLIFTIGPAAPTAMAYQTAAHRSGWQHSFRLLRPGRASNRRGVASHRCADRALPGRPRGADSDRRHISRPDRRRRPIGWSRTNR